MKMLRLRKNEFFKIIKAEPSLEFVSSYLRAGYLPTAPKHSYISNLSLLLHMAMALLAIFPILERYAFSIES